jgi:Sulfotransferase family
MTASIELAATSRGRAPNFFVVGHPKCGTTALYEMLRRHPQIYMPDLKEPVFFAGELPRRAHRYRAPATLEEYLALFETAAPSQRVGEASASYLWSTSAASRIAQVAPDARIIAILREPASFLRSLHLQCLQSRYETERDLRRALALEDARRRGRRLPRRSRWPQVLLYSEHVRYVEQLRRYHALFGRERVLVLVYDDFRRDNEATVRRVLRFLEVDDTAAIEVLEANPSVSVRSPRLDDLVHAVSIGQSPATRAVKRSIVALTPRRARRHALWTIRRRALFSDPPPPEEGLMVELRRRFKGEVVALSEYLDRDLVSLWGYDGIG